jgi:lysyl-tRNA synthetase, class II
VVEPAQANVGSPVNRRRGTWRRALTAIFTAVAGLTTVGAQLSDIAFTGRAARSDLPLLPLHALGIAGGLGLLVLAVGLWRGRRRAAVIAAAALCLIGAARLAYGQPIMDAAIDLGGALFIALNLGAFPCGARSDRRNRRDALALAAGAGFYALYAVVAIGTTNGTEIDRAVASIGKEMPAGALLAGTSGHLGLVVNALIAAIVVLGWTMLRALVRPATGEDGHSPDEGLRAASIVREHGDDSLAPFALRDDKAFHFEAGGFLTYRVLRETAVVSGDPVGPPGSAAAILASFAAFADERGWNVVITAASERHLEACRRLGMRVLRIGDEAVVDPGTFSLEGRPIRKVRQSIARVKRHGWRVEVVDDREISSELERELAEVETDWRERQKRLIGFAMTLGRLAGAGERNGGIYVLGRDPEGRLRSFLSFAPYRRGLSLDLMRRAGDEPNGLTEAMVVAAIECARERELGSVSLNFAGFAHVMAADAALSRSQRLLRWVLRLFHGRFQLERLVRFNAKFFPDWQARYLVYDGLTSLPLSALRVLQAEAYLPAPGDTRRSFGWAPAWVRPAAVATAICLGLTASTVLIGQNRATARPLRVRAEDRHAGWTFVYRGPDGRTLESSLYLPKGRRAVVRIVRPFPPGVEASGTPVVRSLSRRVIRVQPGRVGELSLPCGPGQTALSADVVGPKRFRDQLDASGDRQATAEVAAPAPTTANGGKLTR